MTTKKKEGELKQIEVLPNGCSLYVAAAPHPAGGRLYYTDENTLGQLIWDTALCSEEALLAAILAEKRFQKIDSLKISGDTQRKLAKKRKEILDANRKEEE